MSDILQIADFPAGLMIKWRDESESFISYKNLRNGCPCAYCSGETDVFGNTYIGEGLALSDDAYKLINVIKVGHYAIRITWGDNHDSGIYTFDTLKSLAE
tara:strand:- start:769 stop:1068 length:300 start_codon:yes stop_codon:yes gene_type:complete